MSTDGAGLLTEWENHLATGHRRSPHTVRAYRATAARFIAATHCRTWKDLALLDTIIIRSYLADRRQDGLSNTSIRRELSAIRAFISHARKLCGLEGKGSSSIRGPRSKRGIPRPLTPDDAIALVEYTAALGREDWIGKRDRAVLLLLYGAGLRISEALSLTDAAVLTDETLLIRGKGGKERQVPILPVIASAISEYAKACPYGLRRDGALFVGAKGKPLHPGMVQQAVAKARRTLGLPDTATPHALRHSFASHLLGAGADLRSLQELLGHASLGSTQIYTQVDTAKMLETYRTAHPRETR